MEMIELDAYRHSYRLAILAITEHVVFNLFNSELKIMCITSQ